MVASIRPESEIDRTEAALSRAGLALPLLKGVVDIELARGVERTLAGQRLAALLTNVLARMKGVVTHVNVAMDADAPLHPAVPLEGATLQDGLARLVSSLNSATSVLVATIGFKREDRATARVVLGAEPGLGGLAVACDGWRAMLGTHVRQADLDATTPVGSALGAVTAATEIFKRILSANGAEAGAFAPRDLTFSAYNYGINEEAEQGPEVSSLEVRSLAICGCGAGGSGTAYLLSMLPRLSGTLDLIEPGIHKLSNLNRYLASTATDVRAPRHKLSSLVDHLARFSPSLNLVLHPRPWEQLEAHPWETIISSVDTIEARWQIQERAHESATIVDLGVADLLYSVLRVTPGGRCLFCKHPYDPELSLKQRAQRWGVDTATIREWCANDRCVDSAMVRSLAATQNRLADDFREILGVPFSETPTLLECGTTHLAALVPSQAPVLPLATTAVAVVGAAEIIKQAHGLPGLTNLIAHDLRRSPGGPLVNLRGPLLSCSRH